MDLPNLSNKEAVVLDLLLSGGAREMYVRELIESSGGRLGHAGIYVILGRMKEKGYVETRDEPAPESRGGPPRVLYSASGLGERAFRSWRVAVREWQGGFAV